jgi:hypothetical protein
MFGQFPASPQWYLGRRGIDTRQDAGAWQVDRSAVALARYHIS